MKTIECGIKAFDVHELLCHFVAGRCGFYEAAGLDVRLVDTSFIPDDRLPEANFFQVACGAPLLSRNVRFRIVLAAVARPMFWLYGAAALNSLAASASLPIRRLHRRTGSTASCCAGMGWILIPTWN